MGEMWVKVRGHAQSAFHISKNTEDLEMTTAKLQIRPEAVAIKTLSIITSMIILNKMTEKTLY